MSEVDPDFIEIALKRYDRENNVAKVVSVNVASASGQGDNYSSSVLRATIDVILASGRKCKKSVIIKRMADGKETVKWLRDASVFRREVEVMGEILPNMESLMEEFNDRREIFWPKLIHHTPYSEVIIEDLKVLGYELADRQKGYTLPQAKLVMHQIARFHAMSVILRDRGDFDPNGHVEHVLPHSQIMIRNYIQGMFISLSKLILREWGQDWQEIGVWVRKAADYIPEFMKKFGTRDENRFNVLNHGDLWAPNIMYRYIQGQNDPVSVKFIDYQMTFYTTYAYDLNHFLYSSLSHEVRKNHFYDLLKIYQNSLQENFEMFKYSDMNKVPTYEDILHEMDKTSFFGLIAVVFIMSVVKSDAKLAIDFEAIITPSTERPEFDENLFKTEEYVKCLRECLWKFFTKCIF